MGRHILITTDSTMAEAARQAAALAAPTWILAHTQTAGKGRRGRTWIHQNGNFAASLVLPMVRAPLPHIALRSFVAALAVRDALIAVAQHTRRWTLKWPNDVLLDGGKVAGILLESIACDTQRYHVIIGIGINLDNAPAQHRVEPGACRPISFRFATGVTITPEQFLNVLAVTYAQREAEFITHGFAPIRAAWLQCAAHLGKTVTARTATHTVTGIFQDVDTEGRLVIDTAHGRRRIAAADIFFNQPLDSSHAVVH
mgnify:FL=1